MQPPPERTEKLVNAPVPCISGQAGIPVAPGCWNMASSAAGSRSSGRGVPSVADSTMMRSSWRHITPLGMPVVPPV